MGVARVSLAAEDIGVLLLSSRGKFAPPYAFIDLSTDRDAGVKPARMGGGGGTSLLETPPYVIAIVFLFFLVVTLGFEKILHWITHYLKERGKHGLVAAMNNMTNELMLLGVATLLLLAFQKDIGRVCTAIWDSQDALQNAGEAAALQPLVIASGDASGRRLLGGADANPGSAYSGSANDVVCDGRVQVNWPECGNKPNMRPAIGAAALHQVHLFIFLMAVVHIAGGILLIVLASLRVRFWRKWTEDGDDYTAKARRANDSNVKEVEMTVTGKSAVQLGASSGGTPGLARGRGDRGDLEAAEGPLAFVDHLEVSRKGRWRGRPLHLNGLCGGAVEMFWCIVRQFNLVSVVTKEEFSLMRASFYLTHHIDTGAQFDFMAYLRQSMEDDYASLVGLGLAMWVFLIVFVLLSSVWGWCVWLFTVLAGVVLLVVNTKLIWIARYVTRGGIVHRLQPGIFWFNRPWLLLPVIKYLVFFNTFVFANSIFFASQFGPHSCFFSKTGFQGAVPLSWWSMLLVNVVYFAFLCHLTLPLYSLVVHMGSDIKREALPAELRERLQRARDHYNQVAGSEKASGYLFSMVGPRTGRAKEQTRGGDPLVTTPHSTSKHA
ncbi:hypothetical protein WJX75_008172 [Coccomyxa subellipsoidea]|uniref:MLO-like protein n=1 Tax=Coccomyxa subellipsoidea TaxID=248742 RepID=A0ABR2YS02_9CHLO